MTDQSTKTDEIINFNVFLIIDPNINSLEIYFDQFIILRKKLIRSFYCWDVNS